MTTEFLHLLPRHKLILENLLAQHLPDVEAWVYGSRISGRSHEGSDLDIVLRNVKLEKIDDDKLSDFKNSLYDSSIPFIVDVRDWTCLPSHFQEEISRAFVVLSNPKLKTRS